MKRTSIATALGALFATMPVSADTVYTFDEVVVSATRTEQETADISSSVGVVDRQQLNSNLAQDLRQAVKKEPGVVIEGQGRFGLSGFNIRGREDNYVKVLVDGVEQPSNYNPGADVMRKNNSGTIEIDTLKRVEINKGPVSSLYGSDAVAGAVVMTTLDPLDVIEEGDSTHASIKAGYASADDSFKSTVTLAGKGEKAEALLMYTYRDGHEMKTHGSGSDIEGRDRGQADPFDVRSDNVLAKFYYQANDNHRFGLTGEIYQANSDGDILSNNGHEIPMGPGMSFIYDDNFAKDEDHRERISLSHEWQADLALFDDVMWQLDWQRSHAYHDTFDTTNMYGPRQRSRQGKDESYQGGIQFNKLFSLTNSDHQVTYGVAAVKNRFNLSYFDTKFTKNQVQEKPSEVPDADSLKWGVYVQDQAYFFEDSLVLTGGLRFDQFATEPLGDTQFADTNESAWTGKLGAVYHWNDTVSSFAQFSQGFKAPSLFDMYYEYDGHTYTMLSNPNLKPERSDALEAGLRLSSQYGRAEVTAFYNDYSNFIEQVIIGQSSGGKDLYQKENVAKAKIYGAEFNGDLALSEFSPLPEGSYLNVAVAYAKGENRDTGKALDSVAPLSATLALGYHAPSETFGGEVALYAVAGKKGTDWSLSENSNPEKNNVDAPGYGLVDVTGYYRPNQDITLRAGLFNAFDKKYWSYSDLEGITSNEKGIDRRTQPGRNWGVEVEYVF